MKQMLYCSYGLMFLGLSACSLLQRSEDSGYASSPEAPAVREFYEEKDAYQEQQAMDEIGLSRNYPLNENDRIRLETHLELNRLENRLQTQREKKQYYSLKGLMDSDSERIAFLSLPSVEARERWATNRGIAARENFRSEATAHWIEKNDVALGMTHKAVLESWGDPEVIETSGDPIYGNERWKYTRFVSGNEGYNKEIRFIYFEGGKVVGWETL